MPNWVETILSFLVAHKVGRRIKKVHKTQGHIKTQTHKSTPDTESLESATLLRLGDVYK